VSPNYKQWKSKESGHVLWLASFWKGRRVCWSFGVGQRRIDKLHLFTQTYTKQIEGGQYIVRAFFGARTSHWQLGHARLTMAYVATLAWPSVGVKPNTWKSWGFGVLRDSRMFRARQQGGKHLALGCSWCRWKGLET
jgi:hypothetical protein